jgi:Tol biopolymer transport system component
VFAPNGGDGLYRVSADGGAVTPVTHLDANANEVSHRWPRFLPDGRHFLFLERIGAAGQENRLFVMAGSIDASDEIRRIGPVDATPVYYKDNIVFPREGSLFAQAFDVNTLALSGSPTALAQDVWTSPNVDGLTALAAGGDVIAFRRAATEERPFYWVDAQGRQLEMVGPLNALGPRLSPDGGRLAVELNERRRASWVAGLWIVDLARGATSRVTPTPQNDGQPVWSPDGSRIAFVSDRLGGFDLYMRSVDGGSDTLLFKSPLWEWLDDWSADGKWVLYEEINPVTKRDLYVLPMSGTPTPVPVMRTSANEWFARFSPDGRWIAYVSDESGRDEVYLQAFPSGTQKHAISTSGGTQPVWKRDGRSLYYLSSDNHLVRVDFRSADTTLETVNESPMFQVPLYSRGSSQSTTWLYEPSADGTRFIIALPNRESRPSSIDLLIGK